MQGPTGHQTPTQQKQYLPSIGDPKSPPARPVRLALVWFLLPIVWAPKQCQPGWPGWWAQLARLPFWLALWAAGGFDGHPVSTKTAT